MQYRNGWVHHDELATKAHPGVAEMMWRRTNLTPADVDAAELYDGFSFHTINSLEALGFCPKF
tara:strand:+ start:1297 stop:1485 length:189 start_codon:yes stop_codon:yes gene_type:complete